MLFWRGGCGREGNTPYKSECMDGPPKPKNGTVVKT